MANATDLGGDNNQQQGHAGGLGGVAQDLGVASSYQANGPNATAYNVYDTNAGSQGTDYRQQANAAQGRQAPVINNPYQDQSRTDLGLARGQFSDALAHVYGAGDVAKNEFQTATDQSIAAQQAAANSARGGSVAQAGAQRAAAQQGVQTQAAETAKAAALAGTLSLQSGIAGGQITGAEGGLALGQYQTEQQRAEQQAQLQAQQNHENDSYALGLGGLAGQSNAQQLEGMQGFGQLNQGAQAINAGVAGGAGAAGMGLLGAGLNTVGSAIGGGLGMGGGATPPMYGSSVPGMPASAIPENAYGGGVGGAPATGIAGAPIAYDGNGLPPNLQ